MMYLELPLGSRPARFQARHRHEFWDSTSQNSTRIEDECEDLGGLVRAGRSYQWNLRLSAQKAWTRCVYVPSELADAILPYDIVLEDSYIKSGVSTVYRRSGSVTRMAFFDSVWRLRPSVFSKFALITQAHQT